MTTVPPPPPVAPDGAAAPATPVAKSGFTFTDPGCRTEVRLGALIVLAAVFLWLWLGPQTASHLYLVGAPLLAIGIPVQAIQSRRGRPGYPWKVGLAFTVGAILMMPDLRFRDGPGSPVQVQSVGPLLLGAGLWILAWWPVVVLGRSTSRQDPA